VRLAKRNGRYTFPDKGSIERKHPMNPSGG
jgi:hypothetical protein